MKPDIDLTRLTEDELVALNRRIAERLRFLQQSRSHQAMAAFNIGDTVSFTPEAGKIVIGTVVRLNQKTVTVVTKDGHHWRVAPSFLSRTTDANPLDRPQLEDGQGDVVLLHEIPGKGRHWR